MLALVVVGPGRLGVRLGIAICRAFKKMVKWYILMYVALLIETMPNFLKKDINMKIISGLFVCLSIRP